MKLNGQPYTLQRDEGKSEEGDTNRISISEELGKLYGGQAVGNGYRWASKTIHLKV